MEAFTEPVLQRIIVSQKAGAKYGAPPHAQVWVQHITPTEVFLKGFEMLADAQGKRPKLTSEIIHAIRRELIKLGIEKATWIRIGEDGIVREVMTFHPDLKRETRNHERIPEAKSEAAQYATEGDCELA